MTKYDGLNLFYIHRTETSTSSLLFTELDSVIRVGVDGFSYDPISGVMRSAVAVVSKHHATLPTLVPTFTRMHHRLFSSKDAVEEMDR